LRLVTVLDMLDVVGELPELGFPDNFSVRCDHERLLAVDDHRVAVREASRVSGPIQPAAVLPDEVSGRPLLAVSHDPVVLGVGDVFHAGDPRHCYAHIQRASDIL
jgi:hypothetical protein